MSNDNRYWALILHLRPHQITQRHRPVVFAEDYDALVALFHQTEDEKMALRSQLAAIKKWQEEGERLIDSVPRGAMFSLGEWWADRPWRRT